MQEATKDFFISYNKTDQRWAEWIAYQLEAKGYLTVLQVWDFRPGGNFPLQMHEATRTSQRTIAVLSPDYLSETARFSQAEWAAAFVQDPMGAKLLPIRVRECTPDGLLASITRIDLVRLSEEAALDQLLRGVDERRAKPSGPLPFPGGTFSTKTPLPDFPGRIWNVPYRRNPFFTGRETLLKTLHGQLTGNKTVALTQTLAIHGLGGIGKTQTAVEYAYRYKQEYQAVFWLRAATRETLVSDYVTLAQLLRLTEKDEQDSMRIVAAVKQWLRSNKDWLLILDNADEMALLPEFLPAGDEGHILLTTRDPAVDGMAHGIEVENMDAQEGIELLLRRSHVLAPDQPLEQASQQDRALAGQIVQEMGGLPLAIDQAAAYIDQTRCALYRYLHLYQQQRANLLTWKRRVPADYPETVATTWKLAFEQVEQRKPAAAELLQLCAFLDPDGIPEDLFKEGITELGPELQTLVEDDFQFNEAMDILRSFSLIRRLVENESVVLHRLVQVVIKERMDSSTRREWAEQAVRVVNAAFPEVEFETWELCKRYLPQAFVCFELIKLYDMQTAEVSSLLHRAGWYLRDHARYTEAEPLLLRSLAIKEQILEPEHPDISATLSNLALLYRLQGRYADAEPLYLRALAIDRQTLGSNHSDTSITLGNLANLYRDQGRYSEAEPLFLRTLAIEKQALESEHPITLNNLANLYRDQGRYSEAEPLFLRALAIKEQMLGTEHPDTSTTLNNFALLYKDMGRYEEAEALIKRSLAIDEQCFGLDHQEVATDLEVYAHLLLAMQRTEEAERLLTRAQTIRASQQ